MKVWDFIYWTLFVSLCVWVAASYIDVVADNTSMNAVHHSWNLFVLLARLAG